MSGNAKAIRTRIKSVESTMHITRAMQLVASSKIKRATERMQESRYFFDALLAAFSDIAAGGAVSTYLQPREVKRACYIVLAGDRGLAGGYNANIFRLAKATIPDQGALIIPIGRRAVDHFEKHGYACHMPHPSIESLTMTDCVAIGREVRDLFIRGEVDEVSILYTDYVSALSQTAVVKKLLPFAPPENYEAPTATTIWEPSAEAVLGAVIPQYITGILWGAVTTAYTSELASRRNAMDSATKNADEMIERLTLTYNHARQAAITQEITEIVAGAEGNA